VQVDHPFVDGNKRRALATCLAFLSENGLRENEELNIDVWENLALAVAASLPSRDEIAATLRKLLE
jgi:death-on-curing protein